MINTCALCGGEIAFGRHGLCQNCLKEWTATGTFPVPDWLRTFMGEHHQYEQKKQHLEVPFPEDYQPIYTEVRYGVIEEKYRRIERRGRPRKVHHGDDIKNRPLNNPIEGTE